MSRKSPYGTPDRIEARYRTVGGAEVQIWITYSIKNDWVTGHPIKVADRRVVCLGCDGRWDEVSQWQRLEVVAQRHAQVCRALPR